MITCLLALAGSAFAQLNLDTLGTTVTLDFQSYRGQGLTTSPLSGQLNSNTWRYNDNTSANGTVWGGTYVTTNTTFARGASLGNVTDTATFLYAFDVGGGNYVLGFQPDGNLYNNTSDQMVLKLRNNTGGYISRLNVGYTVWVLNNTPRSQRVRPYHAASDWMSGTNFASLDVISPAAADAVPAWTSSNRSYSVGGLAIPPGGDYFIKWMSQSASGSGNYDELGLDDIKVFALNEGIVLPDKTGMKFEGAHRGQAQVQLLNVVTSELTSPVIVSAVAPFAVSLDGVTFSNSVQIPAAIPLTTNTVHVQFNAPLTYGFSNAQLSLSNPSLPAAKTVTLHAVVAKGFPVTEQFDYPVGGLASVEGYSQYSVSNGNGGAMGGTASPIQIVADTLSTSTLAASAGNKIVLNGVASGEALRFPLPEFVSSGALYASMLVNVTTVPPSAGSPAGNPEAVLFCFDKVNWNNVTLGDPQGRLLIRQGTTPSFFQLGCNAGIRYNSNAPANGVWSGNLTPGQTYFVVLKYDIIEPLNNQVRDWVTLWINPTPGAGVEGADSETSITYKMSGNGDYDVNGNSEALMGYIFPQQVNVGAHATQIDEVRVGKTYASVTPAAATDALAPFATAVSPAEGGTLGSVASIEVTFNEAVLNVAAGGLTVNGSAATTFTSVGNVYTFSGFAAPTGGAVAVILAPGSIQDVAGNAFNGEAWQYTLDAQAPTASSTDPANGATVASLSSFVVTFDEAVQNVVAGNLTVNGSAATAVSNVGNAYTFSGFTPPAAGNVVVALAAGTIQDSVGNAFAGQNWSITLLAAIPPTVTATTPADGENLLALATVSATFSKSVSGVVAGNLTVNGSAATTYTVSGDTYTFSGFTAPGTGSISIVLASGAIQGSDGAAFAGYTWSAYRVPNTWYVVPGGAGSQNGTSWSNAFATIPAGLAAAASGEWVWIKTGAYTTTNMSVPSGVGLYGGFAGTESVLVDLSTRDFTANETTINGGGTARAFILTDKSNVRIDGFTIRNCVATSADGGAVLVTGTGNNVVFANCHFLQNKTIGKAGGAMAVNLTGATTVDACVFTSNTLQSPEVNDKYNGGAIFTSSTLTVSDSLFVGNVIDCFPVGQFIDAKAAAGAAIGAVKAPAVTVQRSRFIRNKALGQNYGRTVPPNSAGTPTWGGQGFATIVMFTTGDVLVENCFFVENGSDSGYGDIFVRPRAANIDGTPFTALNCVIRHNTFHNQKGWVCTNPNANPPAPIQRNDGTQGTAIYYLSNQPNIAETIMIHSNLITNCNRTATDDTGVIFFRDSENPAQGAITLSVLNNYIQNSVVRSAMRLDQDNRVAGEVVSGNIGVDNAPGATAGAYPTTSANDPLYVNVADGDLRIKAVSPVIGKAYVATNAATDDIEGEARPRPGTISDIGADECYLLRPAGVDHWSLY
jgi:hypothetical protein